MIVALITARGGSKGLPGKNILPMNGLPLIGWSIRAALNCPDVFACYVSSDDENILAVSQAQGALPIVRPSELATDSSSSEGAIKHAIEYFHSQGQYPDKIALLQPTSPLRTAQNLSDAIKISESENVDCVISVFEPKHSPVKAYRLDDDGSLVGLYGKSAPYKPRQELPTAVQPNGAMYIFSVDAFIKEAGIPKNRVYPYLMSEAESVDIDDQEDFDLAESLLRKKNES